MRLEDEIKQTKFRSEYQKLSINLTFTSNWLNSNKIQFFKAHGLSPQQYNILRILKGQYPKPSSVGLLLERMLDKSSNVTRTGGQAAGQRLYKPLRMQNKPSYAGYSRLPTKAWLCWKNCNLKLIISEKMFAVLT